MNRSDGDPAGDGFAVCIVVVPDCTAGMDPFLLGDKGAEAYFEPVLRHFRPCRSRCSRRRLQREVEMHDTSRHVDDSNEPDHFFKLCLFSRVSSFPFSNFSGTNVEYLRHSQ